MTTFESLRAESQALRCVCTDNRGNPKNLYRDRSFAEQLVENTKTRRRVDLKLYPCPRGQGYHLASIRKQGK